MPSDSTGVVSSRLVWSLTSILEGNVLYSDPVNTSAKLQELYPVFAILSNVTESSRTSSNSESPFTEIWQLKDHLEDIGASFERFKFHISDRIREKTQY